SLAYRLPDRDLERARHLIGAGHELAIVAALLEQDLGMGFLEVAAADLARRNMGRDGEHRHARAMAGVQSVDEMQIAWSATSSAAGKTPRQMRLGAGCERADLLMSHVDPLDLALTANGVGQTVQAVADDPVDALDSRDREGFDKLICYG